jgi:hypothetical protein
VSSGEPSSDPVERRPFAARRGFRIRRASSGLRAVAPDGAFEVILVEIPTAEPGYIFDARSPPEASFVRGAVARLASRLGRGRVAGPSFGLTPRPAHMPFPEPFTNDAAFDAAFVVRPETAEVLAVLSVELRRALVAAGPVSLSVRGGVVTMPFPLSDADSHLGVVRSLLACTREACARWAESAALRRGA